ncbi:MAG: diaminopimelate decarboxylase [Chloroflexi bacterium]|nr:diaminopimelate decarboxylase [Chloroflexota bacterium]
MPTLPKAKVFPITAEVNAAGHLLIGGCDVMDIVREHGTPTYVYDEATLRGAARAYVTAFQSRYPNTLVAYASKAFINLGLAKLLAEEGVGFDVVSGGEMAVVQAAGVPNDRVHFHGNNKTPQELREAVEWGIGRVVIDSFHEIEILEEVAAAACVTQSVLIRVSPGVDPHTHAHTTTGILDSKFGFPIQTGQAQEAIRQIMAAPHLGLRGLHFHLGSPIFELEPYVQAIGIALQFAKEMGEEGLVLREFSPGGGFAIAYLEEDEPPTPDDYAEAIVGALRRGCQELNLPEPSLIIEPGRAITGPAAVALYTVGTIKDVPGIRTFVAVDGGMGDNIRPALYDSKYEALVANHADQPPTQTVTIAGKYCESGDILVKDARIPAVQAGDVIAIPASGAYSPSMASTYNLNGRPPILLVSNGKVRLVRRRETYADLMSADVV